MYLADYTSSSNIKSVHLPKIIGANVLARSSFSSLSVDSLAIGIKRGIYIYTISASEVIEAPLIKLPATPTNILYISADKILVATKSGILLLDIIAQSHCNVFSTTTESGLFASSKKSYLIAVRNHDPVLEERRSSSTSPKLLDHDTLFYCSCEGFININLELISFLADFYQVSLESNASIMSFSFSGRPSRITVNDYYAIGLIEHEESIIEIRSLKTGSKLQEFILPNASWMNFQDLAFVSSESNLWRLLPLDFDEQV